MESEIKTSLSSICNSFATGWAKLSKGEQKKLTDKYSKSEQYAIAIEVKRKLGQMELEKTFAAKCAGDSGSPTPVFVVAFEIWAMMDFERNSREYLFMQEVEDMCKQYKRQWYEVPASLFKLKYELRVFPTEN